MGTLILNLTLLVALAFLAGCATITRGTTETYKVTSIPAGASVNFSTGESCTTPCELEKKRNQPFLVNISKEGYEPYDIQVSSETCAETATTTVANLVMFGSVLWCSLDAILGSNQDLTPNPGVAKLVPVPSVARLEPVLNNFGG